MSDSSSASKNFRLAFYVFGVLLGSISTWTFNLRYIEEHGSFALMPFVRDAFVNNAAGSLSADILVTGMVGMFFMIHEARRIGMKHVWIYAVLACTVAFAGAFPLFLLMRELHLAKRANDTESLRPGELSLAAE